MLGVRRGVGAPGDADRMSAKTLTSFPTPRQARQLHALPQFKMGATDGAARETAAVHSTRAPARANPENDGPQRGYAAVLHACCTGVVVWLGRVGVR